MIFFSLKKKEESNDDDAQNYLLNIKQPIVPKTIKTDVMKNLLNKDATSEKGKQDVKIDMKNGRDFKKPNVMNKTTNKTTNKITTNSATNKVVNEINDKSSSKSETLSISVAGSKGTS